MSGELTENEYIDRKYPTLKFEGLTFSRCGLERWVARPDARATTMWSEDDRPRSRMGKGQTLNIKVPTEHRRLVIGGEQ